MHWWGLTGEIYFAEKKISHIDQSVWRNNFVFNNIPEKSNNAILKYVLDMLRSIGINVVSYNVVGRFSLLRSIPTWEKPTRDH